MTQHVNLRDEILICNLSNLTSSLSTAIFTAATSLERGTAVGAARELGRLAAELKSSFRSSVLWQRQCGGDSLR